MNEGLWETPIPLRDHDIAFDARWPRRSGRNFSRRNSRAPIREHLLHGLSAEAIEFLVHRLGAQEHRVPIFRSGIDARLGHAQLMAVVAPVPQSRKPLILTLVLGWKLVHGGRLNQRGPITGRIDLRRFLRSCRVGNLQLHGLAAHRLGALRILQPVAAHP